MSDKIDDSNVNNRIELSHKRKNISAPLLYRPSRLGWMKQVYEDEQAREIGTFTIKNEDNNEN
jgi:hypothetical protein